jgi:hypothetical protein
VFGAPACVALVDISGSLSWLWISRGTGSWLGDSEELHYDYFMFTAWLEGGSHGREPLIPRPVFLWRDG